MKLKPFSAEWKHILHEFGCSKDYLKDGNYTHAVFSLLSESERFLEIGFRKGMWIHVCKSLNIPSVHIDITKKLLRTKGTKQQRWFEADSLTWLNKCKDQFDLIFQDGSKQGDIRVREYEIIARRNLLAPDGVIIVDDIHYKKALKAFNLAPNYGFKKIDTYNVSVSNKGYSQGILALNSDVKFSALK